MALYWLIYKRNGRLAGVAIVSADSLMSARMRAAVDGIGTGAMMFAEGKMLDPEFAGRVPQNSVAKCYHAERPSRCLIGSNTACAPCGDRRQKLVARERSGSFSWNDAGRDRLVARPSVGGQQNLRPLELASRVLAPALKCREFGALDLAEFDPIAYAYIYPCLLLVRGTNEQLNRMAGVSRSAKIFTPKQGQYLAYIHLYTRLHRRPPAETDMEQYFRVSPPSVHQMVLTLKRAGFISRQPRVARSIEVLVDSKYLPELLWPRIQHVKITMLRY